MLEQRLVRTSDGRVWTPSVYARSFWNRYLEVFESLEIVARVAPVDRQPDGWVEVTGSGVTVRSVPMYIGPSQYVRRARLVRREVARAADPMAAVIFRAPGNLSSIAYGAMKLSDRPFGVHIVGDPGEVFTRAAIGHPLAKAFGIHAERSLRRSCVRAALAMYVTERGLQERFPPGPQTMSLHYSDVDLGARTLIPPRTIEDSNRLPMIVTVASLEQPYKGVDVLLRAVAEVRQEGLDFKLEVVGDGRLRGSLEALVATLGLQQQVTFRGSLPGPAAVAEVLERGDLFVMASRTEGISRAVLEAMAVGVPVVSTSAGGLVELVPAEDRCAVDDHVGLAHLISATLRDPDRRVRMRAAGSATAAAYSYRAMSDALRTGLEHLAAATRSG